MNSPENSTNPSLVRLLEQLSLYGAALHHANSPVLARLMDNSIEFLRTQNELIVALRAELGDERPFVDGWHWIRHTRKRLETAIELHGSQSRLAAALGIYPSTVSMRLKKLKGQESSRVANSLEPVPASPPSKPAALNTKNTTANPSRSPARKSIATPIQGRSEEQ